MSLSKEQIDKISKQNGIDPKRLDVVFPKILDTIIKPSSLGVAATELQYLISKNVLIFPKIENEQRPWSRLDLFQSIWISLVKELRAFNVPFSDLAKMRVELFKVLLDDVIKDKDTVLEELKSRMDRKDSNDFYKIIEENLNVIQERYSKVFTVLGSWITEVLLDGREVIILLYKEGEDYKFVADGTRGQEQLENLISEVKGKSFLSINLTEIILKFVEIDSLQKVSYRFGILTEQELKIIEAIRKKDFKQIIIRQDHKKSESGKFENLIIEVEKDFELMDKKAIEVRRLLALNQYSDLTITYRNDKHLYIKCKTRI